MDPKLTAKLTEWQKAQQAVVTVAAPLVEAERKLRKEVFDLAFPKPEEGTQRIDLTHDYRLKGVYKMNRKLDEAALPAVLEQLKTKQVRVDELVTYKPSLSVSAYKALPEECRAIMAECVTEAPGLPELELEAPKKAKK